MIVLFTDFGVCGPYLGQMKSVIYQQAPGIPVVELFSDAPCYDPMAAAYLLAAYVTDFPEGTVFLCVVDPGVGSERRRPVIVQADGRWYVGPGNGLFGIVAKRSTDHRCWEIAWRPERLSASFHGRDLFAPIAASLARGVPPAGDPLDADTCIKNDWPEEFARCIYIDHFGNVMTGVRAVSLNDETILEVHRHRLYWARTFSDVSPGKAFWYENANGLVEIAVNQGRAELKLGVRVGDTVVLLHD